MAPTDLGADGSGLPITFAIRGGLCLSFPDCELPSAIGHAALGLCLADALMGT